MSRKNGFALLMTAALSACVGAPEDFQRRNEVDWKSLDNFDPITDTSSRIYSVITNNVKIVRAGSRMHFTTLGLSCADGHRNILLVWDFPVGDYGPVTVGYRFSGQEGRNVIAKSANLESQIIDDPAEVERFLDQAKVSDNLFVRVTSVIGVADAIFMTGGGSSTVDQFRSTCPEAHHKGGAVRP